MSLQASSNDTMMYWLTQLQVGVTFYNNITNLGEWMFPYNAKLSLSVLFSLRRAPKQKVTHKKSWQYLGYYDDVLRAYNENKTTKIRFPGLITVYM